jgi:hypothetical protein
MEKTPVIKSHSEYFELTNTDELNEYVLLLDKISHNNHKYQIVDNDIRLDMFGNPFIIFQYRDIIDLEEKAKNVKKKYSFFGEIISRIHLDEFDELVNKDWAKEIKICYIGEFTTKDKENPMFYRIVIYYKINDKNVADSYLVNQFMPNDKNIKK